MKILKSLYPCEGCCDQCYELDDLRVHADAAYCEHCWSELSEPEWPLWNDADGAVNEFAAALEAAEATEKMLRESVAILVEQRDSFAIQNAELRARAAHYQSLISDIAAVAGPDVPDAIDNDGQPYQSQALADAIKAEVFPAAPKEEV